ncbi:MAG: hypothetical protein OEW75_00835 [Cyclobacteriaceae bacterium]|nr:hypothetical protein [Cyclobacteriaceae bacterium]
MKRFNLIIFGVNLAFHMSLIGFSFYAVSIYSRHEKNLHNMESLTRGTEMEELFKLSALIPDSIWVFGTGSILFILLSVLFYLENHRLKKQLQAAINQQNSYKAQMFDMQSKLNSVKESSESNTEK